MGVSDDVAADGDLARFPHLRELRRKPFDEERQPACKVHTLLAHALQRPTEPAPVAVVELADGEEASEVISRSIEAKRREQP